MVQAPANLLVLAIVPSDIAPLVQSEWQLPFRSGRRQSRLEDRLIAQGQRCGPRGNSSASLISVDVTVRSRKFLHTQLYLQCQI